MKKVFESVALAVLAVFATSCAKENNVDQENGPKNLHFVVKTAENAPVKSYLENNLDGTYTPKWSKGDAMAIFVGDITSSKKATATLCNTSAEPLTATFEGSAPAAEEGYFKGITPAERVANGLTPEKDNSECVAVNLGDPDAGYVQHPTVETIDEYCDILMSKPTFYMSDGNEALIDEEVYFKRVMSVVKVVVNGPVSLKTEKIHSFTLTSSEATLSGRAKVDVTNARVVGWTVPSKSLSAVYVVEENMPFIYDEDKILNAVYFVANPTTLKAGTTLTVSGETDNYAISKEINLPNDIVFPEGQIAVINLSLSEANLTNKTSGFAYSLYEDELEEGDYLIVYNENAMRASVSSDRFQISRVSVEDNQIENTDKSIVWHIEQSGGYWTIYNKDIDKYAASTGVKNNAQLLASGTDEKSLWTVSSSDSYKTFEFVNNANQKSKVNANLRCNGSYGFACYSVSTGGALSLYRLAGSVTTKYEISCSEVSEGGKISASAAKAAEGKEITLTSTPESGYKFDGWSVKDESGNEIKVTDNKFTMPASKVTVSGSFSKIGYTITKSEVVKGGSFTVKVNGTEAATAHVKDNVSLEATAAEGYSFSSWTVTNDDTKATVSVSSDSFTMPAANVTVKATFIKIYSSLEELIADGAPTTSGVFVTVVLKNEVITKLVKSSDNKYTNGVCLNVGTQEIQIYCKNTPSNWAVGDLISGTLINCAWKLYNSTWELCPNDYNGLTRVPASEANTLTVDNTSKTWASDATDAFVINVKVNGGASWNVTPETLDWAKVEVDKAAGTITVTPNGKNETSTANEATLAVTHATASALTKTITLKQLQAGAATAKEYTATIDVNTFTKTNSSTTGYAAYDGEHTILATSKDGGFITMTYSSSQVMINSNKLQFKKNDGKLSGKDWGIIKSLDSGSQDLSISIDEDKSSFTVSNMSSSVKSTTAIVIVFEK